VLVGLLGREREGLVPLSEVVARRATLHEISDTILSMSIREHDLKILWSAAAGRCSFPGCRIVLSTTGETVLGEMAHIAARSPDGPRGDHELPLPARDEYANLILLCPTHHTLIDSELDQWSVERLRGLKAEHEEWVRSRLEDGSLPSPVEIGNLEFLEQRQRFWHAITNGMFSIVGALTPLQIRDEGIIDPLSPEFRRIFLDVRLPEFLQVDLGINPNRHRIESSEHGLVYEDWSAADRGAAIRLELFRSGHVEYFTCAEAEATRATRYVEHEEQQREAFFIERLEARRQQPTRYVHLGLLEEIVSTQADFLLNLWKEGLPFRYATVSTHLIAAPRGLTLFNEVNHRLRRGRPLEGPSTSVSIIASSDEAAAEAPNVRDDLLQGLFNRLGFGT